MWGKPNDNLPLAGGLAGGKDCFKGWFGVTSKGLKGAGLLTTGADFDLKNFEGGFLGKLKRSNNQVLLEFNYTYDRFMIFIHRYGVVALPPYISNLYFEKPLKILFTQLNIFCYFTDGKMFLQDCDDDGETHAGSRMLHLLEILECQNILVVVSRWYGGIQLGPDRFKHINNAARNVLEIAGIVSKIQKKDTKSKKKNKFE